LLFRRPFHPGGARHAAGELDAGAGDIFDAIAGLIEQSLTATRSDETQAQFLARENLLRKALVICI
jgi:hypothetical protein